MGVAEAAGDAAGEFDEAVDGFGAAVVGAVGGEVGQERFSPLVEGAAEAGDLGDRAGGKRREDLGGGGLGLWVAWLVDRAQVLRALPSDFDLDVAFVGGEHVLEAGSLPVGEAFLGGAQDVADSVERVVFAAAVAVDLLLDSAADLIYCLGAEFHDVERVEDCDGVFLGFPLVRGGFGYAGWLRVSSVAGWGCCLVLVWRRQLLRGVVAPVQDGGTCLV